MLLLATNISKSQPPSFIIEGKVKLKHSLIYSSGYVLVKKINIINHKFSFSNSYIDSGNVEVLSRSQLKKVMGGTGSGSLYDDPKCTLRHLL